jgi:hypothetical protein
MAHLRQEHFHAVWKLLLNDEFVDGHEHGIEVLCSDRILRREFLRVFTYAADYPERCA